MSIGFWVGTRGFVRKVERLTRRVNTPLRERRKQRVRCDGRPAGPKLVRGRGRARRRRYATDASLAARIVYLLLGAGLAIMMFKYVLPFLFGWIGE